MQRRRRSTVEDLRLAIDCLPIHTRQAMLDGIRSAPIIAGAYVDGDGGVCPMLAAHRRGGRTSASSFARAWDRYAHAKQARPATRRELHVLETHLEASLAEVEVADLAAAIADHRALVARSAEEREAERRYEPAVEPRPRRSTPRPGDPDRSRELRRSEGWAWLPPFRRLDDYENALALVRAADLDTERDIELEFA
jgi:hypothetical protein